MNVSATWDHNMANLQKSFSIIVHFDVDRMVKKQRAILL